MINAFVGFSFTFRKCMVQNAKKKNVSLLPLSYKPLSVLVFLLSYAEYPKFQIKKIIILETEIADTFFWIMVVAYKYDACEKYERGGNPNVFIGLQPLTCVKPLHN
jgi:hypothetical protein